MTRAIVSTVVIVVGAALIGALAGGILFERSGAELGLIVGALIGLAIGFRYNADMADIAAAQRDMDESHSPSARLKRNRDRRDASRQVFLRDRQGEIWRALAAKRRGRLIDSPHSRYTNQKHHDLELSDIGIRRKSKPKR